MSSTYESNLATAPHKVLENEPPVQFMLGEAMIAQKKMKNTTKDLAKIKEVLAELQIYV